MNWLMGFKFICCAETLWTFIANIRLYAFFVSLHVSLEVTFAAEFLLTNVTCEPSAFVVWLQLMCLQLAKSSKGFWTVSTRVWLCTSVNTNMTVQILDYGKRFSTVRTWMRSYVAVYTSLMCLQVAGLTETFVTQWTLVWFVSSVDSAVYSEMTNIIKRLITQLTFVQFLSSVNSAVHSKVSSRCKSFPQTEHSNGFSPEWIRLCVVNFVFSGKHFPHSMHLNLSLWIFTCLFKYFSLENHFLHSAHEYILSLCVSLCLFSAYSVANSLSQSVRTRGLELLSHAGSLVYASFFISCEISPTKSALKLSTLVY